MKKILLATAFILVLGLGANAQGSKSDSFFGNWNNEPYRTGESLDIENPSGHGLTTDFETPLGSGLLILTALGAGYAALRKRE